MKKQKVSNRHFENLIKSFYKKLEKEVIFSKIVERFIKDDDGFRLKHVVDLEKSVNEDLKNLLLTFKSNPFKSFSKRKMIINYDEELIGYLDISYMFCKKQEENIKRTNTNNADYLKFSLNVKFKNTKKAKRFYKFLIKI